MIITKTPFRVSFAGGGSDIASYYERFGGCVLSVTINKHIYLSMHPYFFDDGYLIKYSKTEQVMDVDKIEHRIIREIFRQYGIKGVDFNSTADIPAGTGLASSSAFTCGLLHLCNAYTGKYIDKEEIAQQACNIEIDILKEPIGKQDQYACACGGLNFIEFEPNGNVNVERVFLNIDTYRALEQNLMLFYTGKARDAGTILSEQAKNVASDKAKEENLHKMVGLAKQLRLELLHDNIDAMGEILHKNWLYKKELASSISTGYIDDCYNVALKAGAMGGKLLGAGGGGFLLLYTKPDKQVGVRAKLEQLGAKQLNFSFDNKGTSVVYYNRSAQGSV